MKERNKQNSTNVLKNNEMTVICVKSQTKLSDFKTSQVCADHRCVLNGGKTFTVKKRRICPDLKLEGVALVARAEVAIPDGAVVHVLLGERGRGSKVLVVDERGTPAFRWAVSWHGHEDHLTWTDRMDGVKSLFW